MTTTTQDLTPAKSDAPDYTDVRASVDLAAFRAAALFMAQNDIRYCLNGVLIERDPAGNGCWIVATNGSSMFIYGDPSGVLEGKRDRIIVRPSKAMLAAASRAKQGPDPFRVLVSDKRLMVATSLDAACDEGELFIQPSNCQVEGDFPDWRRVVPEFAKLQPGHGGTINSDLFVPLQQASKILSPFSKLSTPIQMWSVESRDQACVQFANSPRAIVIIMPMRADTDTLHSIVQTINSQRKKPAA